MSKFFKLIMSLSFAFVMVLCGCSCRVTPVAFVEAIHDEGEVVVYTSHANSGYPHIIVFEDEADMPNPDDYEQPADFRRAQEVNCAYYISFMPRHMGKFTDEESGKEMSTVDISKWYEMTLVIVKDSYVGKKLYLNGEELTPWYTNDDGSYTSYKDFEFKRGNPNGKIDGTFNTVEVK